MNFKMNNPQKINELMELILQSMSSAIFTIGSDFIISDSNNAFKEMFQNNQLEINGQNMGNVIGCSYAFDEGDTCGCMSYCDNCQIRKIIQKTLQKKQSIINEKIVKEIYNSEEKYRKYFQVNTRYVEYDGEDCALVLIDDITEDEQRKKKFEKLNRQSKESEKKMSVMVKEQTKKIQRITMSMITALENVNYFNDTDTGNHIRRVCKYSAIIARGYGCDEMTVNKIELYASLHDIGKVGISDKLLKKAGMYTPDEHKSMQNHVLIGTRMLESAKIDDMTVNIIKYHHERFDGEGYQSKLRGTDIPLEARIVALADVYDALSTKRSYREEFPEEEVDKIIRDASGSQFDPDLVKVFFENKKELIAVKEKYLSVNIIDRVDSKFDGDIHVLALVGRITFDTIEGLYSDVKLEFNSLEPNTLRHILDLRKTNYLDSVGLGLLVKIRSNLIENEAKAVIVVEDDVIKEMFEVFNISELYEIYPTFDDAVSSLSRNA